MNIFTAVLLLLCCTQCCATAVLEMNLDMLCMRAGTIFAGTCLSRLPSGNSGVTYTFRVDRWIKGSGETHISFTMNSIARSLARAPSFKTGDEALLFLYPESDAGFTSPIGLGQGTFRALLTPEGKKILVNERNNTNLFTSVPLSEYKSRARLQDPIKSSITHGSSGPIAYGPFIAIVGAAVETIEKQTPLPR